MFITCFNDIYYFTDIFKMDSIESISESIGKSQVVELNELEEREHPLYVYEENGIEYVNGKWFLKEVK